MNSREKYFIKVQQSNIKKLKVSFSVVLVCRMDLTSNQLNNRYLVLLYFLYMARWYLQSHSLFLNPKYFTVKKSYFLTWKGSFYFLLMTDDIVLYNLSNWQLKNTLLFWQYKYIKFLYILDQISKVKDK